MTTLHYEPASTSEDVDNVIKSACDKMKQLTSSGVIGDSDITDNTYRLSPNAISINQMNASANNVKTKPKVQLQKPTDTYLDTVVKAAISNDKK